MNRYESYYPRPQLRRDSFYSLCGRWQLNKKDIEIPFPPESKLSCYEGETSELYYEKVFSLPEDFYHPSDNVILHFGAVDQICDVFFNDYYLGHHEGGYLPFSFDITDHIKKENLLVVKAKDDLDLYYPYGKQTKDPKGMWYTPVSGIWQSVWLEAYDRNGIDDLKIESFEDHIKLQIVSNSDRFTFRCGDIEKSFREKELVIEIPHPHLWDCEDPYLYDFTLSTEKD